MSDINISRWSNYLQDITNNSQRIIVVDKKGKIQVEDKDNISRNSRRLSINQIISITLESFENSNTLSEKDRLQITNGLKYLEVRHSNKYNALHPIGKFFAEKKVNENLTTLNYIQSLIHTGHNYTNFLLRDFDQESTNLAPEVIELGLATLLKDKNVTNVISNHASLYKIGEKAAKKYLEKNQVQQAFRVRMLVAQVLIPQSDPPPISILEDHHLSSLDTSTLKNGSMHVKKMVIDGKSYTRLMFKVNSHEREKLNLTLEKLHKTSNCKYLQKLLPKNFCTNIKVEEKNDGYYRSQKNKRYTSNDFFSLGDQKSINFEGAGFINVGSSNNVYSQYNRFQVFIPSESENMVEIAQTMLSAVGLGGVLIPQRQMDDERMKIFQLLRFFYPKEARAFETDGNYFSIPILQLQKDIMAKIPGMEEKLLKYLINEPQLMYKQEVYPGKEVWAIQNKADDIKKLGGVGLMAGVGHGFSFFLGADYGAFESVAKMLEFGALSSQDRYEMGLIQAGASSRKDLIVGGGDHVYTRLITKNDIGNRNYINNFPLSGTVQVLYDLKILERGGFAYTKDQYGTKESSAYDNRSNLETTTQKLSTQPNNSNEFMIKNRIPPQYIKGLVVQNRSDKSNLLDVLRDAGRIEKKNGLEYIKDLNIPVNDFIHVNTTFNFTMWRT